jgi:hypothetical protein
MAIELTPLHPTLAAELRGVDLTRQGAGGAPRWRLLGTR